MIKNESKIYLPSLDDIFTTQKAKFTRAMLGVCLLKNPSLLYDSKIDLEENIEKEIILKGNSEELKQIKN